MQLDSETKKQANRHTNKQIGKDTNQSFII